jgi:hypothetical protein
MLISVFQIYSSLQTYRNCLLFGNTSSLSRVCSVGTVIPHLFISCIVVFVLFVLCLALFYLFRVLLTVLQVSLDSPFYFL